MEFQIGRRCSLQYTRDTQCNSRDVHKLMDTHILAPGVNLRNVRILDKNDMTAWS